MIDLGISIISTKEDINLFTDNTYQNKVKEIVEQLKAEHEITKEHSIACHKDHIELYKKKELVLIRELV